MTITEHPAPGPALGPKLFTALYPLLAGAMTAVGIWGLIISLGRPELIVHPTFSALLADLGIPSWALITVSLLVPLAAASALASLVWVARRTDWRAMVFAVGVLGIVISGARASFVVATSEPGLKGAMTAVDVVAILAIIGLVFLFPTGTFRPGWARWPAAVAATIVVVTPELGQMVGSVMTDEPIPDRAAWRMVAFLAFLLVGGGAAQVIRFRTRSTEVQRNQIKWVLIPFAIQLVCASVLLAALSLPETTPVWIAPLILFAAGIGTLLPVTVGIALFRHHLYDVDRVISRTVTYTVVLLALVGIYSGTVLVLQNLLPGDDSLSVAASTLVAVAALNPLRRRVRDFVDRRFHRAHYDARMLVDQLAARARDELEVAQLEQMLVELADRAVRPSFVSVWVRTSDG